ncbi:SbcC/MukB-like Walker B domain-containing protein [Actinoalloteichus fjordicus]|uniref:Exonuclease SbcCD, C subunit n=1 Tax=Actinoalloteichus fjordicus TaxID=1612552 RepID=A0AAC9LDF8_9PSEU|nr:SbcC/MukB-like Walker B domain-containing protein [Actinoalloteichus fjordicus]APU15311.1 Putative exonuclease SbcCD, C subunit [Actinoalloteichus fjordicus]
MTTTAPAELLYSPARPSRRRWEPVRAGITGLFHYDEQIFTFHRGRLLLRGNNGSGKSMALEVLLPYVLDADLAPERLSTFGVRDRGMFLWLLGHDPDEGRASARGYVWVEFGRITDNGDEFYTVGAGLHGARASKRVTAWYFTTAGRVGHQFELGVAGTEPKSSNQLAAALADLNAAGVIGRVHPTPDAHRQEVNRVLFGLDDRQFEALRKTLLHLRKPKLSDKLSETKLDEVLRDSLPSVNQAIIDELADGFERLDRHREIIAELTAAHAALAEISTAYTDFLNLLVGRRAADVVDAVQEADKTGKLAAKAAEDCANAESSLAQTQKQTEKVRSEIRSLGIEIESIRMLDLYKEGAELTPLREKAAALTSLAKASRDQAAELQHAAARSREAAISAAADANTAALTRDERAARADSIASLLPHAALSTLAATLVRHLDGSSEDSFAALAELRDTVRARIEELDRLRDLVSRSHKALQLARVAAEATTKAKYRVVDAEKDAEDARTVRSEELSNYLAAVTEWIAGSTQLVLGSTPPETWPSEFPERAVRRWSDGAAQTRRTALAAEARALESILSAVTPLVRQAADLSTRGQALGLSLSTVWTKASLVRDARIDFAERVSTWFINLVELTRTAEVPEVLRVPAPRELHRDDVVEWASKAATVRLIALEREATVIKSELASLQEVLTQKQGEHSRLESGGLPRLPVPAERLADREGRVGSPLFLLVDFVPGLDQGDHQRAMLEAALVGSELADAWVFPDGTIAAGPDGEPLLDVQISTQQPAVRAPLSAALCPDPALPPDGPVSAEVVRAMLARIGLADTAAETSDGLTVAWDGTWSSGPLRGAFQKNQVELIGAGSREAMRLRLIADLAVEISNLESASSELQEKLRASQRTAAQAELERGSVPANQQVRAAESEQSQAISDTAALLRRVIEETDALAAAAHQVTSAALNTLSSLGLSHELPGTHLTFAQIEAGVAGTITSMLDGVWTDKPDEPDVTAVLAPVQLITTAASEWQRIADRAAEGITAVGVRSGELESQAARRPSETALVTATFEVVLKTRIGQGRVAELKNVQEAEVAATDERDAAAGVAEAALEVADLSDHRDRLDDLRADTERFRPSAEDWINAAAQCLRLTRAATIAHEEAGTSEVIAARSAQRAADAEQEALLAQQKYDSLNAHMGKPHQELMLRLAGLESRHAQQTSALEGSATQELERGRVAERRKGEAANAVTKVDEATARLNVLTESLADVHRLGLLRVPGVAEQPARFGEDPLRPDQLKAVCGWAVSLLPKTHKSAEQQDKAQTRAGQVRTKKEQDLTGHVVLRERVDRGVFALTASRNGRERPLHDTVAVLAHDLIQTEKLLEKEEAELFERFLSDEVRLEVGQRVQAAVALVQQMNGLMSKHATSSGYLFKLRWVATAEAEMPPDMMELLRKPEGLLFRSERDRLSAFYRRRIASTRTATTSVPWREQLAAMLDYRTWHRFELMTKKSPSDWAKLDRRRHGAMSGGEKAVALHLPLFAAAATHCEASRIVVHENGRTSPGCPRLILLDEVFAGVDAKNRGALFDLVTELDLDLVATSESELGLYQELDGISIYHLIVDDALPGVLAARSVWDGRTSHDMLDHDLNEDL